MARSTKFDYDVVLSFAGKDRPHAEALYKILKRRSIKAFYDTEEESVVWGKDLVQYLQGIFRDKGKFCVIFVSKAYSRGAWPKLELKHAQERALKENEEYILPIRLDDTKIPGLSETTAYADLRKESIETIASRLVDKLELLPLRRHGMSAKPLFKRAVSKLTDRREKTNATGVIAHDDHFRFYSRNVFINLPSVPHRSGLFRCLVFATIACGFNPRCGFEIDDTGEIRLEKISRTIEECRFGIHDLSNLGFANGSLTANMPLELGMFLSAKRFGDRRQRTKVCLVVDRERYRYQRFISDISGQDIREHRNNQEQLLNITCSWLSAFSAGDTPPSTEIFRAYRLFKREMPKIIDAVGLPSDELTFNDYANIVTTWLRTRGME
jgi:hypothetical protein